MKHPSLAGIGLHGNLSGGHGSQAPGTWQPTRGTWRPGTWQLGISTADALTSAADTWKLDLALAWPIQLDALTRTL